SAAELEPFDPEFVSTYEIGLKSEWFDNRLRFNGAAFFSDYTDIQLQNVSATDLGDVLLLIENVGEAELSGFELELTALPLAFLELSAGAGYIDAKYTKLGGGVSTVTTSSSFAKAPRWNLNFSAQFTLPVGNNGRLRIRADSSYQSEVFNEPANIPSVTTDSVWRVNARAVYEQLEQGWEVALFVTNLTDAEVIAHGLPLLDALGFAEAIYAPPREFGISFTKRFGG
ncbi:MAG: TonB-dependent receptor, partial [Gammaproteobacteria bacterium]|nr:TonB-dependent receptor [Gammaproteobacteria bacterium]